MRHAFEHAAALITEISTKGQSSGRKKEDSDGLQLRTQTRATEKELGGSEREGERKRGNNS